MWLTPCDKCGYETENIWTQEDGSGLCYQCADRESKEGGQR